MCTGASRLMEKYAVQTCGYCPEIQVGPKGHRVRNCQAYKHQMRDRQHAWQEGTRANGKEKEIDHRERKLTEDSNLTESLLLVSWWETIRHGDGERQEPEDLPYELAKLPPLQSMADKLTLSEIKDVQPGPSETENVQPNPSKAENVPPTPEGSAILEDHAPSAPEG
ncbi:hypothetical protein RJT34_02452 [Clitoria ternatea]|uniref:APO domain-containing protein n=1 Tax=Clitoria ternatea TaxID=43366 RepID=A0AAN9Q3X5_CLITE